MRYVKLGAGLVLVALVCLQPRTTAQSPVSGQSYISADAPLVSRSPSGVESFTEPYRTVSVAAPESGVVTQVYAREGTRVAAGQPLVSLDVDYHEILLQIARAGMEETGRVEASQADVAYRWQRVEQIRKLREMGSAQQTELDRAVADLAIAEGQLKVAQGAARLKVLEYQRIQAQIDRRTIRAPTEGVVTHVFKEPGEFTAANDPTLLTVVQLNPLVATFRLSQEFASTLEPEMQVELELANGMVRPAAVEYVSPLIDAPVDTVEVKVRIPNADGRLPAGMRCQLRQ
jgi:RND family efflux transporter MFP subunit